MVFRMDLIPETEQLHIIKIGLFGFQRSCLVSCKDLEKINFEQDNLYPGKWYKSMLWRPSESKGMVYRNKITNEIYTFSNYGIWNDNGISHELLH
jgi:hypothetical protein